MPKPTEPATSFAMTSLDREILPRCAGDIDLWMAGYFDGRCFPYQRYFYHAPQKDKLLIAGIRTGKSRLVSMGFLHFAQYHPHSRLLNTSISSEQAKIVYLNCMEFCQMPRFKHWVEHVQSSPYPMIRLVNGSELNFRSLGYEGELLRGFEYDLANIDECSYVTRENAIKTVRGRLLGFNNLTGAPRLGHFWMVSSPKPQPWLMDRWKRGDPRFVEAEPNKYLSLRATIWDNPLLNQESIEDLMADYSDAMIRQELYAEFLESNDSVFPYALVMACCDDQHPQVRWLYDQIKFWQMRHTDSEQKNMRLRVGLARGLTDDITHYECEPIAGHRYISSWDLGKKTTKAGRNAMVGLVFDITHEPWVMVGYLYREGMTYVEAKAYIEQWHAKYSSGGTTCQTVIDATGKGDVLQEFIENERTIDKIEGIVYSSANKPNLIHAGKIAIERGLPVFPFIRRVVDQLTGYALLDKDLTQDIVMAFCQAMYVARTLTRISDKAPSQRLLNSMYHYNHRSPQARIMNPRFVQSRLAGRTGRIQTVQNRGRLRRTS